MQCSVCIKSFCRHKIGATGAPGGDDATIMPMLCVCVNCDR